MTIIKCTNTGCYFRDSNGYCTSNFVEVEDSFCITETDYTHAAPEYQNEYWIRLQKDGVDCRSKQKGYKYVYKDLVLYTRDDIRNGMKEVYFDEEKTGMRLSTLEKIEENYDKILQKINAEPNVMTFPEADASLFHLTSENEDIYTYGEKPF